MSAAGAFDGLALRNRLERFQALLYATALGLGALVAFLAPEVGSALRGGLWPLLALLLWVTFLQVPLLEFGAVLRERRYFSALLVGNFVLVPLLVALLVLLLPGGADLRLGVALVLLVPCTDWFATFAHLGRGDGRLALYSMPALLVLQLLLLPLFLWLILGPETSVGFRSGPFLTAFAVVLVLPLVLAFAVERAARTRPTVRIWVARSAIVPVPLLATVMLLIAAAESRVAWEEREQLFGAIGIFVLYAALVPVFAKGLAWIFQLQRRTSNTLLFSLGTRNSFVVLPLVLAWPGAGALAASAVVTQSLVELCAMLLYVHVLTRTGALRNRQRIGAGR